MKERLIAGLDLGSSAVRLVAGQLVVGQDKRETLQIVGATEVPSHGISKGLVNALEEAVTAISMCLEQAERQMGLAVTDAYVGISGTYMTDQIQRGVIGVSRPDGEIRSEDVQRALDSVRALVNPSNYEILHILPRGFTVDGQTGIKDPVGMQGIRLEVDAHVIQGVASHVRNVTKAVLRTGIDMNELVYSPLCLSDVIATSRQKDVGVAIVNIGASTTSLAVYEEGDLLHSAVIPIGADHITADIAIGLRTSLEIADVLKRQYVNAAAQHVNKFQDIDLQSLGAPASEIVSLRFISDIAQARVEELFERVEQELKKIDRSGMLPAGVLLTGGGVKLEGMPEVAKQVLRLPAVIAQAQVPPSALEDILQDPAFSTALGLVRWGFDTERSGDETIRYTGGGNKGGDFAKKIGSPLKKLFKSFIP